MTQETAPAAAPAAQESAPAPAPEFAPAAADSLLSTATGETPAGTETPAAPVSEEAKPAAPELPEKYELTGLPDGAEIDGALAEGYTGALREAGLTQAQADKLTPFLASKMQEMQSASLKAWQATNEQWVSAVKADPDIGGAKLPQSLAAASRAIDAFGGPALRSALSLTGAGNNPAVVKAFVEIGKAMADDMKFVSGKGTANAANTDPMARVAAAFYGGGKK